MTTESKSRPLAFPVTLLVSIKIRGLRLARRKLLLIIAMITWGNSESISFDCMINAGRIFEVLRSEFGNGTSTMLPRRISLVDVESFAGIIVIVIDVHRRIIPIFERRKF